MKIQNYGGYINKAIESIKEDQCPYQEFALFVTNGSIDLVLWRRRLLRDASATGGDWCVRDQTVARQLTAVHDDDRVQRQARGRADSFAGDEVRQVVCKHLPKDHVLAVAPASLVLHNQWIYRVSHTVS